MSVQFCYDIINNHNSDLDIDQLKLFVQGLYTNKKICSDPYTCEEDELPYVTIFSEPDKSICIMLLSKTKANLDHIKKVHSKLKLSSGGSGMIDFNELVSLSLPYEWTVEGRPWEAAPQKNGARWKTLTHFGPYFSHLFEPYKSIGGTIKYNDVVYELAPEEERVARYYASRRMNENDPDTKLTTFYTKDSTFNTNFWNDFKTYLTPEHAKIFTKMEYVDWSPLERAIMKEKEKEMTEKDKRQKKVVRAEADRKYGYAYINGYKEKVGNYAVEPAGLFLGRGLHPLRGKVKPNIMPEDITINTSGPAPNPPQSNTDEAIKKALHALGREITYLLAKITSLKKRKVVSTDARLKLDGEIATLSEQRRIKMDSLKKLRTTRAQTKHQWKSVVNDPTSIWLSKWTDPVIGGIKYIQFAPQGLFKGQNDFLKYEAARKLAQVITTVRESYMNDAVNGNLKSKQLGTVLFFIDNFGIRVGNEKDQDEAETVGATTLESGHIELNAPNGIKLHFLGKDSILFSKMLVVPDPIFRNLEAFKQGKAKNDQLFNLVDATDINEYLKQFDKTFSAKVFRTRLATSIMLDELSKLKVPKKITKKDLDHLFKKANVKVAEVLNHTRNVPAGASKAIDKLQDKIKINTEKMKIAKTEKAKNKLKEANKKLRKDIKTKQETKGVAVTTSLTNYIDPRVVAQWMAKYEIPPAYVYSAALLKKFKWAIDSIKSDWNYETEPLFGVSDDFVGEEDQEPPVEDPVVEPPVENPVEEPPVGDPIEEPPVDVEDNIPKKKASPPRRSRSKRTPVAAADDVAHTYKKKNKRITKKRIETLFKKPSWISEEKYNEYTFELADYCEYGKEPSIEAIESMWHLIKRGTTTKSRELMGLYFNLIHIFSK